MELDLDDLLGRVNLIDRQITREEREQKARARADERKQASIQAHLKATRSRKYQSHSVSPAEPHSPHDHQRQLREGPEQERHPAEVSPRRYIEARSEILIHAQATWEEEHVREYILPREASQSSSIRAPADAPEDPPPSYSEAAEQTQQAEPSDTSRPIVKKKKQQIRAKKYEGALRFLAGRRRLGSP